MTVGRLPSIEGGIQPTIVDAKGDLIAATAADTPARLAVGANDTVLTADSAEATGLKWSTPSSGGMTLLSTTTLSTNSVTISGISGSYKTLYVIGRGIYTSSADGITVRVNSDSGSNYTDYYYVFVSSSGLSNGRNTSSTGINCGDTGSSSSAANYTMFDMRIDRYAETEVKQINTHAVGFQGSVTVNRFTNTVYSPTGAITALNFLTTTGGGFTFSGGTIYVYGVN
jgi:trimeric autotransporter adhesin